MHEDKIQSRRESYLHYIVAGCKSIRFSSRHLGSSVDQLVSSPSSGVIVPSEDPGFSRRVLAIYPGLQLGSVSCGNNRVISRIAPKVEGSQSCSQASDKKGAKLTVKMILPNA